MESAAGGVLAADLGRPVTAPRVRRARLFYRGLAIVMLIAVFGGFAPSYYLKTAYGTKPGAFLIASQVLRVYIGGTESWLALARWLVE